MTNYYNKSIWSTIYNIVLWMNNSTHFYSMMSVVDQLLIKYLNHPTINNQTTIYPEIMTRKEEMKIWTMSSQAHRKFLCKRGRKKLGYADVINVAERKKKATREAHHRRKIK